MADAAACLLELEGVTRTFPGVLAVEGVSLTLRSGEIHALVGENGAGKTTLLQLISGVLLPDAGTLRVRGEAVVLRDPTAARQLGILAVHQELELFGTLSVAENLAFSAGMPVGRCGRVRWGEVERQARQVIEALDEPLPIHVPVAHLTVAQRQLLLVAAAVLHQADMVLLDEPTSALTSAEADWLSRQLVRLRARGTGILYITHRHEEVFRLANRITVLRDGRRVWQGSTHEIDPAGLIREMVGREATAARPVRERRALAAVTKPSSGTALPSGGTTMATPADKTVAPRLGVRGLTDRGGQVRGVSLSIERGEIVGLYGLVGAGRSELAQTLCGYRAAAGGEVLLDGQACRVRHPADAVRAGLVYVPEDRLHQGLFRGLSVRANLVLASLARWTVGRGWLARWLQSTTRERQVTAREIDRLGVRLRSPEQPMGELSGGNQQKIVLARWLLAEPRVLVLDEPTRGVDVAAKAEIQGLVTEVARRGAAVLWISSELPEVLACSDRLLVLRQGMLAAEFDPARATAEEVARAALPEVGEGVAVSRRGRASRWQGGHELGLAMVVVLWSSWLAATQPAFLTSANLLGVLNNNAVWTLLALAASVVILSGAIDISLGSLFALSAGAAGLVLKLPIPPAVGVPLALAAGVGVGLAGGLVNAGVSLAGRVHPVVVTLGTMTIYRGLLIGLTGGETVADLPPAFGRLANGRLVGLEGSIWWWLMVLVLMQFVLRHTVWGRRLYAVGSSHRAAWRVGISPERTWLGAFGLQGALVGLAGVIELARNGSLQSGMGTGYELRAIAAAVIGGTAITGGRGSVMGVALGALLLGLLYNGLVLWQVSIYRYELVMGGLLLAAIVLDWGWRRLAAVSRGASEYGV